MTTSWALCSSPRTMETVNDPDTQLDRRAERRATRRAENRAELLDAAERVFGEDGIRDGSLRKIAKLAGFSPAAIYLFFENKQDLLSETCIRRADEWDNVVREAVESQMAPLDTLHRVIDLGIDFFAERPYFRLLLRHIRGGPAVTGPVLAEFADNVDARYLQVVVHIARIVQEGQAAGQIQQGNERSLAHLFWCCSTSSCSSAGIPSSRTSAHSRQSSSMGSSTEHSEIHRGRAQARGPTTKFEQGAQR